MVAATYIPFHALDAALSGSDKLISVISHCSGYLSVCIWLFAQLPQIIENHLNQSVEGVSILFLGIWMCGDATNLIGCLLTGALPFQTSLALYYCFIDCILGLQFWYYTKVYPYQPVHHNLLQSPDMVRPRQNNKVKSFQSNNGRNSQFLDLNPNTSANSLSVPQKNTISKKLFGAFIVGSLKKVDAIPVENDQESLMVNIQTSNSMYNKAYSICNVIAHFFLHLNVSTESFGRFSAWVCSILYISSRAPQIYKNYREKSTKGISFYLFLFAMLGNTFYTICITTDLYLISKSNGYYDDLKFKQAFFSQLPFIIGSAGTVTFDCIILFQCWLYNYITYEINYLVPSDLKKSAAQSLNENFIKPNRYTSTESFKSTHNTTSSKLRGDIISNQSCKLITTGVYTENTPLINGTYGYYNINSDIPPPHYIIGSAPSNSSQGLNKSSTLNSISNSILKSLPMNTKKSPAASTDSFYTSMSPQQSSSLIPSIVGTYSSLSKKMKDDAKIPFSPIDFLHDEFHNLDHSV